MKKNPKYIYLVVGRSGSGKSTIVNKFIEKYPNYKALPSYTTRPKRYEDEKGHLFVTEKDFFNLNNMVAYTKFNGYHYCATSEQVDYNDFYIIDIDGIKYFKKHYKGKKKIKIIYIESAEQFLIENMKKRGDTIENVNERIVNDSVKFFDICFKAHLILENYGDKTIDELVDKLAVFIEDTEGNIR